MSVYTKIIFRFLIFITILIFLTRFDLFISIVAGIESNYSGEVAARETFLPQLEIRPFGRGCPYTQKMSNGTHNCGSCRMCFIPQK